MERYEIEKLRNLPIEVVAERLGLTLARHKALCPFHDDHHASLTFDQRRNAFRCFACEARGDVITLVMRLLGKTFTEACRWLAQENCIILEQRKSAAPVAVQKTFDAQRYLRHSEHPWLSDEARRFLLTERRLDPAVIRWCRLHSWQDRQGTHWLQIPYFSATGKLIGVQNRNLDYRKPTAEEEVEVPRFRFPRGACCTLYNQPVIALLRPGEPLYITEGASDCWAMLSAGHKAVAIPSATLLTEADKRLLAELVTEKQTTLHMYPDRDAPGERLFMQLREVLPNLHHHQLPQGCKDFGEAYAKRRADTEREASTNPL